MKEQLIIMLMGVVATVVAIFVFLTSSPLEPLGFMIQLKMTMFHIVIVWLFLGFVMLIRRYI